MSFKKIDCNLTQKFDEYPDFGVLNGVKVFVSGTAIAGPFAGCLMAEMGAKVLQSEAPQDLLRHARHHELVAEPPQ